MLVLRCTMPYITFILGIPNCTNVVQKIAYMYLHVWHSEIKYHDIKHDTAKLRTRNKKHCKYEYAKLDKHLQSLHVGVVLHIDSIV